MKKRIKKDIVFNLCYSLLLSVIVLSFVPITPLLLITFIPLLFGINILLYLKSYLKEKTNIKETNKSELSNINIEKEASKQTKKDNMITYSPVLNEVKSKEKVIIKRYKK